MRRLGRVVAAVILLAWPGLVGAEGWYALIPPLATGPRAPLTQWEQVRAFDSAEACEKMATGYARQVAAQTDNLAQARYRQVQYIRCVHASDSRLRENSR